jgi:hypothetical protein
MSSGLAIGNPEMSEREAITVEFSLSGAQEGGRASDLDNLLDPVFSVVINRLGWCGGRRPNLRWIAAEKTYRSPTGARITLESGSPSWPRTEAGDVLLHDLYEGSLPRAATDTDFANWVRAAQIRRVEGKVAVRLSFAILKVNLGEIATGPVKPLLDGLWPVLGGNPAAPHDWRVGALLLEKEAAVNGVAVEVIELAPTA